MSKRIVWLDVLKFIGIILIYFVHYYPGPIGAAFAFVSTHHVHVFFFAAGCSASLSRERDFRNNCRHKAKTLLVPFYVFSLASLTVYCLFNNISSPGEIIPQLIVILNGNIRDRFCAPALWFLTCIFVVSVLFSLLQKLKNRYFIAGMALLSFILTCGIIASPVGSPRWFFNIDSALHYLIFYTIGYYAFPYINGLLSQSNKRKSGVFVFSFVASAAFAVLLYFGKSVFYFPIFTYRNIIPSLFNPLIMIWFWICTAHFFENVRLFENIGKKTLLLCCNEYIIKIIFISAAQLFAVELTPTNQLNALIYSVFLIFICYKYFIPGEERIGSWFKSQTIQN